MTGMLLLSFPADWQDGISFYLCAAFALVSAVALIQLIRMEYGWTAQKIFHLMTFIVNGVRAVVFGFHMQVGSVTAICFTCFLVRCLVVMLPAFDLDASSLDVLNLIYYLVVEILPSAFVLYILRKLPPKIVHNS